jgi:dihydrofolate synthase/folylpolyglutamate synthase
MADHIQDPILSTIQQYREAEKWLWSLITDPTGERYFQEKSMETRMVEFREQIERMQAFLDATGSPEKQYPSIHVAGTSGKGSVVSMLAEILSTAGQRVGFHVSPYLQVCNEKLIVDRRLISPLEFVSLVEDFRQKYLVWQASNGKYPALKYGEAWVALTFMWMAHEQVDWAVIETGLGGRYDPTNVVPARLAVITNVDYDHTEVLGESLPEIAAHKAGIIKPGGLAITFETKPEVLAVIKAEAAEKGARLYCLDEDFRYTIEEDENGKRLTVDGVYHQYSDLRIAMKGDFQLDNAALSVASLDLLAGESAFELPEAAVRQGLLNVRYGGRLELVQERPLVILDGAHNHHKAVTLVKSLKALFPGKKMTVVLGTLSIKDFSGIIQALLPVTGRWIATQPKVFGKPSAAPEQLAQVIQEVAPSAQVALAEDVTEGIKIALQDAGEDEIILVTGSLYMIGDARDYWFPTEELLHALEQGANPN